MTLDNINRESSSYPEFYVLCIYINEWGLKSGSNTRGSIYSLYLHAFWITKVSSFSAGFKILSLSFTETDIIVWLCWALMCYLKCSSICTFSRVDILHFPSTIIVLTWNVQNVHTHMIYSHSGMSSCVWLPIMTAVSLCNIEDKRPCHCCNMLHLSTMLLHQTFWVDFYQQIM